MFFLVQIKTNEELCFDAIEVAKNELKEKNI